MNYAIAGEGAPVLVIHGAGGGYDQGLLLAAVFADDAKRIAISRPGFLGTPLTDFNAKPEVHAKMYAALLDALGETKVNVLAFSDGGPSAIAFANQFPERCLTLTLVAAKSQSPPPETFVQKMVFGNIFKLDFGFWLIAKYGRSALMSTFGVTKEVQGQMTDDEMALIDAFLDAMQPMHLRINGIVNEREVLSDLSDEAAMLESIHVKTLVVHAKDDMLQSYDYGVYSASHIKNAVFLSFDTGGHMLIGHHEALKKAYHTFIENAAQAKDG
jgi:pimeloyl-ACP methyl ester carboxylesterase